MSRSPSISYQHRHVLPLFLNAEVPEFVPLSSHVSHRVCRYEAAHPLHERALAARTRALGAGHMDTLASAHGLGVLLRVKGEYGAARPLLERALAGRERGLGDTHAHTLESVDALAELHRLQDEFGPAEPLIRRALEARERVLGHEHPTTLTSRRSLASLHHSKGELDVAEPLYRRTLEARPPSLSYITRGYPQSLLILQGNIFIWVLPCNIGRD